MNSIGVVINLMLPEVDEDYIEEHKEDDPIILYPNEITKEYSDAKNNKYLVTNYGRVYSYKKNAIIKSLPKIYMPTWFKNNFSNDELNNEYFNNNIKVLYPNTYYERHREARLEYQKKYRENNLDKVKAAEKKYREAHKEEIAAKAKIRRDKHNQELTEEEIQERRAKNREYYRRRKERLAAAKEEPKAEEESKEEEEAKDE